MQNSKGDRVAYVILSILIYGGAWLSAVFFWLYAFWILLKQDRILEAVAVLIVIPVGVIYGVLRFFGWL